MEARPEPTQSGSQYDPEVEEALRRAKTVHVEPQPEPTQSGSSYPPEVEEALRQARLAMHGFVQVDQSQIDRYQS